MPPAEEELTGPLVGRLVARTGRDEGLVTVGVLRPKGQAPQRPRGKRGGLLLGGLVLVLLLALTLLAVGARVWGAGTTLIAKDPAVPSGAATPAPCRDLIHLLGGREAGTCGPAVGSR
jgi:hypothetical protein